MANRVLAGSKVSNPGLGLEYWQHRMGTSFDDLDAKRNFVYRSVDEAFIEAMKKAIKPAPQMKHWFLPVFMGYVNGSKVGYIGMIRYRDSYFEFSYFETGNRDHKVSIGQNIFWEEKAIRAMNENLKEDEHYPYYHNITHVAYDNNAEEGFGELFFKAALTFVNAFSRCQKSELTTYS